MWWLGRGRHGRPTAPAPDARPDQRAPAAEPGTSTTTASSATAAQRSRQRRHSATATTHRRPRHHRPPPPVDTTVPPGPFEVTCSTVSLPAGAVSLPAERCEPVAGDGPRPAVLVLNGCGGYEADAGITTTDHAPAGRGRRRRACASTTSRRGRPSFHLLRRRRHGGGRPGPAARPRRRHRSLRADPTVDPARIGAVGYSLGGLAVGFAQIGGGPFGPLDSPGFGAIGLLSAVIPSQIVDQARVGKLPPVDDRPRRRRPGHLATRPRGAGCRGGRRRRPPRAAGHPGPGPRVDGRAGPAGGRRPRHLPHPSSGRRSRSASATDRWATTWRQSVAKSPIGGLGRAEAALVDGQYRSRL